MTLKDRTDGMVPSTINPTDCEILRARISFLVDFVLCGATIAFLYVWMKESENYFSPYFLQHGFCDASPNHFRTQENCAHFDWIITLIGLIVITTIGKKDKNKQFRLYLLLVANYVVYPFLHGTAHYLVSQGMINPQQKIHTTQHVFMLAAILAVGPAAVASELHFKGQRNPLVLALVFIILDSFLTWFFMTKIMYGVFVLLYINAATNLMVFSSRVILFNPFPSPLSSIMTKIGDDDDERNSTIEEAVRYRNMIFGEKFFYQSLVSMVLVVVTMWVEPTQCGNEYPPTMGWFAIAGGHIWFDVALASMSFVCLLNTIDGRN